MGVQVFTVGELADILKKSPGRINYVISRDRIKPSVRVANIRLFDEIALEKIRLSFAHSQRKVANTILSTRPDVIA